MVGAVTDFTLFDVTDYPRYQNLFRKADGKTLTVIINRTGKLRNPTRSRGGFLLQNILRIIPVLVIAYPCKEATVTYENVTVESGSGGTRTAGEAILKKTPALFGCSVMGKYLVLSHWR